MKKGGKKRKKRKKMNLRWSKSNDQIYPSVIEISVYLCFL